MRIAQQAEAKSIKWYSVQRYFTQRYAQGIVRHGEDEQRSQAEACQEAESVVEVSKRGIARLGGPWEVIWIRDGRHDALVLDQAIRYEGRAFSFDD